MSHFKALYLCCFSRSVMDRLGDPVHNIVVRSSGSEDLDSPPLSKKRLMASPKSKKEKKKKKEKKAKKEKKKKKSRKVVVASSDSDLEDSDGVSKGDHVIRDMKVFDEEEEKLLKFFEEEVGEAGELNTSTMSSSAPSEEDVMIRMKKKNEMTLKRMKEIEEDKRKHK